MIVVISTAITYTTFSMNQITQLAESIEGKQIEDFQQTTETYEILKIRTDDNQFNMTVVNTGDIPVHLTRLWVENTTDSSWPVSKYDLDIAIPTGGSVYNIGRNLGLTALDTQSYLMELVTERGNTEKIFLNSVGGSATYLNLRATPSTLSTGFTTTLLLEVVNNGTAQLLNLQPEIDSEVTTCTSTCTPVKVSGPKPAIVESLRSGDTALFEYIYSFDGEPTDYVNFTASLVNGINSDSVIVTIQAVESALNADVALEAQGLGTTDPLDKTILLFHQENTGTPSQEYQMYSGTADGGANGLRFQLDTPIPPYPKFMTNNGTKQVIVPAGNWNVSLALQSEALPGTLKDEDEDMIFHFEDGTGVNPDNSESDSSRDLEGCGGAGCTGWYNVAWTERKQIVIQGSQVVGGAHANFPVMVRLDNNPDLLASAQADGDDILFTNSDGTVKLDHEIEHYAGGSLVAWVEVPSIRSGTDTAICMYFGNAAVGPQENVAGTWSNDYEAVWHFHNDFTDSANSHDGTNNGSVNATGIAAGGQDFEQSQQDYVNTGSWSISGNNISMQAWIKWESIPGDDPRIISKNDPNDDGSSQNFVWMLGENNDRGRERIKTGTQNWTGTSTLEAGSGTMSTGNWYLLAASYDGSNMRIFLDGDQKASTSKSGNLRVNDWPVWIGSSSGTSPREFDGIIDEVRISSHERSEDWFETEFNNLDNYSNFIVITSGGGGGNPTWVADSGPHSSGSYLFDGVDDCFQSTNNVSDSDDNDIDDEPNTTALWFRTNGVVTSEQYLVYWDGDGTCPSCEYYKIGLDNTGKIKFEFETSNGVSEISTCLSTSDYDDDSWHHITAVRGVNSIDDLNDSDCVLHIHDIDGNVEEKIATAYSGYGSNNDVDTDGRWVVGSNQEKNNYFFNGYIDDLMHWNGDDNDLFLNTAEAEDLAKSNYGDGAHQINFSLDVRDSDGLFLRSILNDIAIPVPFYDPKTIPSSSTDDLDSAYTLFNHTMVLPQQTIAIGERLNFTMSWVTASSTWEPLELDMKIDDVGFVTPFPSYIQIPTPDNSFASYLVYDNDFEFDVIVANTGKDGIFYIYQGTRVNFYDAVSGSYAGLIDSVNGTSSDFELDENKDSIYIGANQTSRMYFDPPTDHPSTTGLGTLVPPGEYIVTIWIQGYSDHGETFARSAVLGTVTVVD